jgi:hypothetical protein
MMNNHGSMIFKTSTGVLQGTANSLKLPCEGLLLHIAFVVVRTTTEGSMLIQNTAIRTAYIVYRPTLLPYYVVYIFIRYQIS